MITPSLDEILEYEGSATHATLALELAADTETPISLYFKLSQDRPNSFLLESVEGGTTLSRYSFVGFDANKMVELIEGEDPLDAVESALGEYEVLGVDGLPRFFGGAVGYAGYDCIRYFEPVPVPEKKPTSLPEALFMLVEDVAILDHLKQRVILVTHIPLSEDRTIAYMDAAVRLHEWVDRLRGPPPPPRELVPWSDIYIPDVAGNMTADQFKGAVLEAKEAICAGEIFQVVLSQRFTVPIEVSPLKLYRALRGLNPSPYMFYLRFEDFSVVGASPEVLVRKVDDEILVRPIAGTRLRGKDAAEDKANELDLLADKKELAEHRMLLDLGRNDVGRVAQIGSVRIEDPLHIERYSHVMHIVSDVYGKIRDGKTAYDVLRAGFPAGTVSGAPKIRAMEIISKYEPDRRGLYAGCVGYFSFGGNMDTCIAIRTMVVEPDAVHVQAGAGVVYDSIPENEHQECLNKARGALMAVAEAASEERGR